MLSRKETKRCYVEIQMMLGRYNLDNLPLEAVELLQLAERRLREALDQMDKGD